MGLFDKLSQYYAQAGWTMVQAEDDTILSARFQGEHEQWIFVASCDEQRGSVTVFSRAPLACSPERFSELERFLNQLNFGLVAGAWVLDRSDGEIRFQVGVHTLGLEITDIWLAHVTQITTMMMGHYLPALRALIEGGQSADDAFAMIFGRS